MPSGKQIAPIDGRARLDALRTDGRVVAAFDDHAERRVELPVDTIDVRDALQLCDRVVGDRARHRGEPIGAGLEWLDGHEA